MCDNDIKKKPLDPYESEVEWTSKIVGSYKVFEIDMKYLCNGIDPFLIRFLAQYTTFKVVIIWPKDLVEHISFSLAESKKDNVIIKINDDNHLVLSNQSDYRFESKTRQIAGSLANNQKFKLVVKKPSNSSFTDVFIRPMDEEVET